MKRHTGLLILILVTSLVLTFTQVFAVTPQITAAKKTPPAVEIPKGKPERLEKKGTLEAVKEIREQTKAAEKIEKLTKPSKTPRLLKTPQSRVGKPVNFRGTIASVDSSSLAITVKKGGSITIDMDGSTRIHIPTLGFDAAESDLKTGMEVTVHAENREQGANPLARSIHVIPGQPSFPHHISTVQSYVPGSSISITAGDGTTSTYDISGAKILPETTVTIPEGATVTLVFARKGLEADRTVIAVIVHPAP